MPGIVEILGFAGVLISCLAYLPQILHLWMEHCSAGLSIKAWILWLAGNLLILTHAFELHDPVFLSLQVVNIVAISVIIVLTNKYKNMVCNTHSAKA